MSKKFFARGSDGLVTICDGALTESQIDDPLNNLASIWFHSDLEYLEVGKVFTGTANFPLETWYADQIHLNRSTVLSFDTGLFAPLGIGFFSDGQLIDGFSMIQRVDDQTWRAAGLHVSGSQLNLVHYPMSKSQNLPAISKDYVIYALDLTRIGYV